MAAVQQQMPTSPDPSGRMRNGSRTYSLHSDKSNGPPSTTERAEKERRDSLLRGESKANPNAAVQELQPQARNVLEKVTLDSIRSMDVKDSFGNAITEPDLSNPTRPRWERPLDTIRSFEKAIDGDYTRRSVSRNQSDVGDNYTSRRTSYMSASNGGKQSGYYDQRPESRYDQYGGPQGGSRNRLSRGMSEGGRGQYPQNNMSYDGSDTTGPWANSTDPSSQNSSFERLHGVGKQPQRDGYGNPINEEVDDYGFPPRPPMKNGGSKAPPPPAHAGQAPQPIKLGGGSSDAFASQGGKLPSATRAAPEKESKKGFFGRRFSKKD